MTFTPLPMYEPTPIASMRDPQGNNSTATKPQVDPQLHWIEPEVSPLVSVLSNRARKAAPVRDFVHTWFKKYPPSYKVTSLGAVAAGVNVLTLKVGDGAKLALDYSLINLRTEEVVRVSVAPTTDSVTCVRGFGDNGPFDVNDGDVWLILGPSREDGAGIGALRSTGQTTDYNYPEITRHPFGLTGRMIGTERYVGPDRDEAQRETWHEHAKSLERKLLLGTRDRRLGTLGNGQNMMGGARFFIRRNVWDMNWQNLTQTSLDDFLLEVGKYGGGGYLAGGTGHKMIFCGRAVAQQITRFADSKVRYQPNDRVVGMDVDQIRNAAGTFSIMKSGIFDAVPELATQAYVLDINEIEIAPFIGRDTSLLADRQANDIDGRTWEYFTDMTSKWPMQEAHGRIINVGI